MLKPREIAKKLFQVKNEHFICLCLFTFLFFHFQKNQQNIPNKRIQNENIKLPEIHSYMGTKIKIQTQ